MKRYHINHPLKHLGQNFLIDTYVIKKIVQVINPQNTQLIVEIGSGMAALTKPICDLLKNLIIIEIDINLLLVLKKYPFFSKLIIFCQDILTFDYLKLFNQKKRLIRVFGNLPYNISIPILLNLFKIIYVIKDMNFMLQKEVADRLVAQPGNKLYGRLSILAQYYCNIKIILKASPEAFSPVPKVQSIFVNLTPHKHHIFFAYDIDLLEYITNVAFQQRRKTLRHSLSRLFSLNRLKKLDIDPSLRAENVSIFQYCCLTNYLVSKKYKILLH